MSAGNGFLIGFIVMLVLHFYEKSLERKHREQEWKRIYKAVQELGLNPDDFVEKLAELSPSTEYIDDRTDML